jgi:hypothetical protein
MLRRILHPPPKAAQRTSTLHFRSTLFTTCHPRFHQTSLYLNKPNINDESKADVNLNHSEARPKLQTYIERKLGPRVTTFHTPTPATPSDADANAGKGAESVNLEPDVKKKKALTYSVLLEIFPFIKDNWLPSYMSHNVSPCQATESKYHFNEHTEMELGCLTKSILAHPKQLDLILKSIRPGTYFYLKQLVNRVAKQSNAEVISLDPQALFTLSSYLKDKSFLSKCCLSKWTCNTT